MKNLIGFTLVGGLFVLAGFYLGSAATDKPDESADEPREQARKVEYWVAPMDPNFRRDEPGKSPMGMDLVPVYADEASSAGGVTISPALENNLGVQTALAEVRPLWRRIEATGYVGLDETRISHINIRTQGWIERLFVNAEGTRVSKGDLLFELYSPELVNAQKEYLQALRRGDTRLLQGADGKLRALGMIPSEIDVLKASGTASERIKIVAPRDGVVTELLAREGMYIQPNTTVMSLADLGSVWLQAEVFESQVEWVAEGQAAEATLEYMPGAVFSGEVEYVYPVLDAETRTLRVRLRFDNHGEKLKPNMYARVSIFGRLQPRALSIPRQALIRGADRDRVVVALGEGRFTVHEVLTGMESGDWVEILAGIDAGDRVVTSAQFLIDSEASLVGSIIRLGHVEDTPANDEPVKAFGNGWIEEIKAAEGRMRISHGPIDALGWPAMNMEFGVDPAVDLANLEVGQDIRFQIEQISSGRFVITAANLRDNSEPSTNGDHDHD
ncbi:efflux RND transporter periplasmic adaptor subunit [Marinihelvus fidelis]|uniref:Efflux RND transporter periplasmic adaptor subunit n=1 Tax=Marinihelvus fidelis TaxID=2613842 RepID=A0A5N0TGA4_9GAMM|nr:efflux RND transporter periplasmic adaptor subunit [Marinihelvus fidelis]KAA9133157.1 efflux RND transporter periplasmic adaptor subunit [Marinihelvus fidelis]